MNLIYRTLFIILSIICMPIGMKGQELTFLGVSLELSQAEIHDALLEKGLTDRESKSKGEIAMFGDFWKFNDCNISIYGFPDTKVSVTLPSYTTIATMQDLISSLNAKYGIGDDSQSNDFKTEIRWKVGENYIIIYDFYIERHNFNIIYMSKNASKSLDVNTKNFDDDL